MGAVQAPIPQQDAISDACGREHDAMTIPAPVRPLEQDFDAYLIDAFQWRSLGFQGVGVLGALGFLLVRRLYGGMVPGWLFLAVGLGLGGLILLQIAARRGRLLVLWQVLFAIGYCLAMKRALDAGGYGEYLLLPTLGVSALVMSISMSNIWHTLSFWGLLLLVFDPVRVFLRWGGEEMIYGFGFLAIIIGGMVLVHLQVVQTLRSNHLLLNKLKRQAFYDSLSSLPNRRSFLQQAEYALGHEDIAFYLAIIDIDLFKRINDTHGHAVGDQTIREVSALLAETFHDQIYGRIGGEEFGVLLAARSDAAGQARLECFRQQVRAAPFPHGQVTVSAGVCLVGNGGLQQAFHRADQALYQAKSSGRDRVIAWQAA